MSPSHVEKRPVPGWFGYHSWWFVCHHIDAVTPHLYNENPFFNFLKKSGSSFDGRTFPLPLLFTEKQR